MELGNQIGEGALPDSSASAGTPEESIVEPLNLDASDDATLGDQTISDAPDEGELSDDIQSEMKSVIEANANDSQLVRKLRDLVKTKYEDFASRTTPELSPEQKEALELVNGLYDFDVTTGTATTRSFAEKIAAKDIGLASQAFEDLSSIPVDENGFTLGHKFLEKIGLDPYKLEELRQFSRGELNPVDYGIVKVHEGVPRELSEAYKSLDPVTRTDVDIYLDSDNDAQRAAALRTLRNQQIVLNNEKYQHEQESRQKEMFSNEVTTATETDLQTTYSGVLNSLRQSPAYTNVTVSSDKNVDTMVKDSIITALNALGDPRSVLAQQAVQSLEARGVKVDVTKVGQLMQTIETATKTAITAERMGKLQGRDYSTQIQEALARKSTAVSGLVALGNKYFSQTLANLTGKALNTSANPKAGLTNFDGKSAPISSRPDGVKTMAELDAEILNIAKGLQASQ